MPYRGVGVAGAALWREKRLPEPVRWGVPAAVLAFSLGYAAAIDVEMMTDSRYAAEAWFRENVEPPSSVGAFRTHERYPLKPQYLPRVHELGYATYPVDMRPESFDRPQPEYLILTSYNYAAQWARPFLMPLVGPHGTTVTRHYPVDDGKSRLLWIIAPVIEVEASF